MTALQASGNYFKKIVKTTLKELKEIETTPETFTTAIDFPTKIVEGQFYKLSVQGKHVDIRELPDNDGNTFIVTSLKKFDPDYDPIYRSKSDLKKLKSIGICLSSKEHCRAMIYSLFPGFVENTAATFVC